LDHLGLIAGKVDEPDLPELIDTVVEQDHEQRQFPVGLCVKAILLIGFGFVNQVLYLILHFFRDKPVEHLNDDALGESLDAIYARLRPGNAMRNVAKILEYSDHIALNTYINERHIRSSKTDKNYNPLKYKANYRQ